jgi:hypothetical protein
MMTMLPVELTLAARIAQPSADRPVSSQTKSARLSLRRALVTRYYEIIFVNPIFRQI